MTKVYVKESDLAHHVYQDICEEALQVGEKYGLTDIQINLYNHICRGDFYFRNGDGDMLFNPGSKGIGWYHDRDWVKKQLQPLIKAGLVVFEKVNDCRDGRYTSWYFYDSRYQRKQLIEAGCFASSWRMFTLKEKLDLPDGWFQSETHKAGGLEWSMREGGYYIDFSFKGKKMPYGGTDLGDAILNVFSYIEAIENPYPITEKQKQKIEEDILVAKKEKKRFVKSCYEYAIHTEYSEEQKREWQTIDNYISEMKEKYEIKKIKPLV